ncbi:hypothetical protein SAMN04487915_106155 [Arthrobacter sp. ov118]|nr:hypothetical protein SAMN04487915_106155 [Arthrobacter sp. ov118]
MDRCLVHNGGGRFVARVGSKSKVVADMPDGDDRCADLETAGWATVGTDIDELRELPKAKGA